MTNRQFGLSKSKISAFEQCPRRLWQQTHAPERAVMDDAARMSFAAGHAVGDLACAFERCERKASLDQFLQDVTG